MDGPGWVTGELSPHLRMFVDGDAVENRLSGEAAASTALRKRMNSPLRWRCMQRGSTMPAKTSRAANGVVQP